MDQPQLSSTLGCQLDQMRLTHELGQQTIRVDERPMPQRLRKRHGHTRAQKSPCTLSHNQSHAA